MKYTQVILGLAAGVLMGYFFIPHTQATKTVQKSITTSSGSSEAREGGQKFTNPLLDCINTEDNGLINELHISKNDLNDFVNNLLSQSNIGTASVYVRDLNNGPWVGINPEEVFIGGSLLKVPLLISYLKVSETDPGILKKVILYDKKLADNRQYFRPLKEIELGKKYTIQELINYMINYSDNNAAELLMANLKEGEFDNTFEALGFGRPDPNQPYPVSTKTYAAFFRILFNSSYLNRDNSEKALKLLSSTDFNYGITKLLPTDVTVSHKFGIRTDNTINQLHDCGIVYYPNHPYIMCIMTKGGSFDDLGNSISKISKFVYDQVSQIKSTQARSN